jgi:hypothetical protein
VKSKFHFFEKARRRMLLPVVVVAVMFHFLGIYAIQGMGINPKEIPKKGMFEKKYKDNLSLEREKQTKIERKREINNLVAEFFQKKTDIKEVQKEKLPTQKMLQASVSNDFSQKSISLDTPTATFYEKKIVASNVLEKDKITLEMEEKDLIVIEDIQVSSSFDQDSWSDSEDIMSSLPALEEGQILLDDLELVSSDPGTKIGVGEFLSFSENTGPVSSLISNDGAKVSSLEVTNGVLSSVSKKSSIEVDKVFTEASYKKEWLPMGQEALVDWELPKKPVFSNNNEQSSDDEATLAKSEDFDVTTSFFQDEKDKKFYFRIQFIPKEEVVFKRIRQNMFFLIDRSNSISKEKYAMFKEGVKQSLDYLQPGDRFNILVFDKEISSFSIEPSDWNLDNVKKAGQFLDEQEHGGLFASTELYASLGKIIPKDVAKNEVNTAILLSDGDTFLSLDQQRVTIKNWTSFNDRKVSLYAAAAGKGNNLALLDLLTSFNKGRLAYVDNVEDVSRLILSVVGAIQNPIGKDIQASIVLEDNESQINLFPQKNRLPDLYQHVPYVLYARMDNLEDFHVFLQGKYYDTWLDIKHKIEISQIHRESKDLKKQWWSHRAFDYYQEFLNEGKTMHLREAQKILKSFKLPVAFR